MPTTATKRASAHEVRCTLLREALRAERGAKAARARGDARLAEQWEEGARARRKVIGNVLDVLARRLTEDLYSFGGLLEAARATGYAPSLVARRYVGRRREEAALLADALDAAYEAEGLQCRVFRGQ